MSLFKFYCDLRSKNHAKKKVVKSNKEVSESVSKSYSSNNKKENRVYAENSSVSYTNLAVGGAVAYSVFSSNDFESDDDDDE